MNEMIRAETDFESPRIDSVKPSDGDYVLIVTWGNGETMRVDLTEPIFRLKHLRPLRNRERFHTATVGEWGWSIAWDDDLEISAERVWELARDQAQVHMTPSEFRAFLSKYNVTQQKMADLLGISKRSVSYYATGEIVIPRTVALALKGLASELKTREGDEADPVRRTTAKRR